MYSSTPKNRTPYALAVDKIPSLVFASFGITLLSKVTAIGLQTAIKHETAFDAAVELLLHYPKSFRSITAFFVAVLCLLCFTLFIEPAYFGKKIRNGIIIPSLSVAEHMISLTLGVFCAWFLIELKARGNPFSSVFEAIAQMVFMIFGVSLLAVFCALLRVFLITDYESFIEKLGRFRYPVVAIFALLIFFILSSDYIWNYPIIYAHHT